MAVKLGQIIQTVRKKSGLTQKELADLAGVGKTTVFDVENEKSTVRFSNIVKICTVLNIRLKTEDPFGLEAEIGHSE